MTRHTLEQAAILDLFDQMKAIEATLLARIEVLEAENRSLNARISSLVAMQRAGNPPRTIPHLPAVMAGLEAKRTRQ